MDFKAGIDQAESEATRHATDLANDEHRRIRQHLVSTAKNSAHSLAAAKTIHESKATDLHDHAIVVGSLIQENERAQATVRASSRNYEVQVADLNNQPPPPPPASAPPTIAPLTPPTVIVDRRSSDRAPYPARHLGRGRLRYLPRSPTPPVR